MKTPWKAVADSWRAHSAEYDRGVAAHQRERDSDPEYWAGVDSAKRWILLAAIIAGIVYVLR